jgi:hypothetical protein
LSKIKGIGINIKIVETKEIWQNMRITLVLPKVGLDIGAINNGNSVVL